MLREREAERERERERVRERERERDIESEKREREERGSACCVRSLDWMTKHCQRFGITPQPHLLADKWGFGHLEKAGASRNVFTNGMDDGWSARGVTQSLSPTPVAVNTADGAHHSDLSHSMPAPTDTPDVVEARKQVKGILGGWLAETLQ